MSLEILKTFPLDFTRNAPLEYIFAKAGDQNSRILDITPLNSGAAYTIPEGTTARFAAKKPDGTQVLNDTTIENGHIKVTLSEQTLAADGILVCEVQLYGTDNEVLSSQHFYLKAEPFALDDVESSDEYGAFRTALLAVDAKVQEAEEAIEDAGEATAAANAAAEAANTATGNANTAAEAANNAAAAANNVNISAEQTATGADITITNREGEETTVHLDTMFAINTWADIRNAVRMGLGATLFPVGYEFTVPKTGSGNIVFVVRAHDHHIAANDRLVHTMTLETKSVFGSSSAYKSIQFDGTEALYFAEDGLAAGTYNFTLLSGYDIDYGGGKTYQFTLAQDVPAGGCLMFPWGYQVQADTVKISSYASLTATTAIESVSVIEGSVGTSIGVADGNTENMNHAHRIRYGSNNYAQSAIRQWLNSSAALGSVWAPKTKFDRPPTYHTSSDPAYAGLMNGLDPDFLAVVEAAVIPCRTNGIFEVNSLDGTEFAINQTYNLTDNFFLLSRPEIYGTWDSASYKDGELLEFYDGLTDTERIKYDAFGAARIAWLRSPFPSYAYYARNVLTGGSLNNSNANTVYGAAAACIIA